MAALTDRQKARERLSHAFESILDKMVPADEAVPLPGGRKFVQWEDLADEVDRTLVPMGSSGARPMVVRESGGRRPGGDATDVNQGTAHGADHGGGT